jgi:hypothetical protein
MSEDKLKLSPTSLGLFIDCPRCFWLQMKQGIKRPEAPMSTVPNGLDLALKWYFDRYRNSQGLPPILQGKMEGSLVPDQDEISKFRSHSFGFWEDSLDAGFYGMLDECVIEQGKLYAPLDHKTRGFPPKETHEAYIRQVSAYALMLRRNGYPTSASAYLVYYYPLRESDSLHNGFPFAVEVRRVATEPDQIYRVFVNAVGVLRSQVCPQARKTCAYCGYIEQRGRIG